MIYVGIDNGVTGAIAVLSDGETNVIDMPIVKVGNKRNYNTDVIQLFFRSLKPNMVFLEYAQGMPGQGIVSTFTIGKNYGFIIGVLTTLRIPFQIINPKKWQKEFSIAKKTKEQSYSIASRLYPQIELTTKRGRVLDGRADALLIATYGKRLVKG